MLNTLNIINYRYNTGKRSAPAFTQATAADLDKDASWKGINDDLEKEGLDEQSIAIEQPFIRKWIDDVILAEDNVQTGETSHDDESVYSTRLPPTSDGGQDRRSSYTESIPASYWSPTPPSRKQTDQTLVDRSPPMKNAELFKTKTKDSRASTSSLEQRQISDQPPRNKQIQASLVSLFRLEHGVSRDLAHLRTWIEHLFQQLDTRQRGIFRGQVEGAFMPAIEIAKPSAKQTVLDIILSDTSRPGSRFDQAAFVNMMFKILETLDTTNKSLEATKTIDGTDNNPETTSLAESIAYAWLTAYIKDNYTEGILPYGWISEIRGDGTRFYTYLPHNITCHSVARTRLPPSAMSTITCMSLMISRCITELSYVLELWERHAELDEEYLKSYLNLIDDVLEAAYKFEVFDTRQAGATAASLDEVLGQAEIVDLTDSATLGQMKGFPIQELRELQRHAYRSLQSIISFLIELTTEEFQSKLNAEGNHALFSPEKFAFQYPLEPPAPGHFRIKMESMSSRILADTNWWEGSIETINACRSYAASHKLLARRAKEALDGSRRLGVQARKAKRCRHIVNLRSPDLLLDKFINLTLVSLDSLPKGNKLFRAGPPDVEAKIEIDNIEFAHKSAVRTQVGGKDVFYWNEGTPFHISISTSSTLFIRIHNTKRRVDRIDEGFLGLIKIPLSSLPMALDAEPTTMPLSNVYRPGLPAGNLTLRAHWCPLTQYVRTNQSSLASAWARKETADDRFYFEDLRIDEKTAGSRTAIFETRNDTLVGDVKPLTAFRSQIP